jgi:hypothetical protein
VVTAVGDIRRASAELGLEVVFRVLNETATHAGHIDMARDHLDGHQHRVVVT